MAYEILKSIVEAEARAVEIKKRAVTDAEARRADALKQQEALLEGAKQQGAEEMQRAVEKAVAESRETIRGILQEADEACSKIRERALLKKEDAVLAVKIPRILPCAKLLSTQINRITAAIHRRLQALHRACRRKQLRSIVYRHNRLLSRAAPVYEKKRANLSVARIPFSVISLPPRPNAALPLPALPPPLGASIPASLP